MSTAPSERLTTRLTCLQAMGFDESTVVGNPGVWKCVVGCSRCCPSVINGIAVHERTCPNEKHECAGCNEIIPANQKYCEDCK